MELFVLDAILILILTICGCFYTDMPFVFIALAGVLMCFACFRSLKDGDKAEKADVKDIVDSFAWLILSMIYALVSGFFLSYLVMWRGIISKKATVNIIVSPVVYFLVAGTVGKEPFYMTVLKVIVLLFISLVLCMLKKIMERYVDVNNQVVSAVSVTAINEMYARKLNQELTMKSYLAEKNARLEERENISRNIHNNVGHSITAAIMTLDAADMLYDAAPEKAREKMNTANERMRTSLESIRQAVRVLDSESRFVSIEDFISELSAIIDNFVMDTMIKVHTDFEDVYSDVVIPHEHTEFLTGAAQELLSNGVRHGGANVFIVSVVADSSNLKVRVTDNGKSDFDSSNQKERIEKGFGLKKMISYVNKCGGNISFSNDNGFRAEMVLKLYKEDGNE